MPCVVAVDLVISHEYTFKYSRENIILITHSSTE